MSIHVTAMCVLLGADGGAGVSVVLLGAAGGAGVLGVVVVVVGDNIYSLFALVSPASHMPIPSLDALL